ncbi:hypothetical protein QVD17_20410 [Tagetes erecta]|uniref:Uncharacterized protein n=1 Tax=Tagetes erecta TaxID=13708 RepID=A0AAD8KPV9_TARER|nr:hypothetical protein QVD17_20410 [Tagetes erecta]
MGIKTSNGPGCAVTSSNSTATTGCLCSNAHDIHTHHILASSSSSLFLYIHTLTHSLSLHALMHNKLTIHITHFHFQSNTIQ